ncbi:hypothetical protein CPC08DRAFT_337274 [Agrocybe pediades]|nr:hypothetical protein CPC08DRAFT_337274 [Agrocybe pediades]
MMPESTAHVHSLSSESLSALLHALGLADHEPRIEQTSMSYVSPYEDKRCNTPFPRADLSPSLDELQAFRREYLSDIDIFSDLEEDSDFDTLPSRPGSSIESFDDDDTPPSSPPLRHRHNVFVFPTEPTQRTENAPYCAQPTDFVHIKAAHNASIIMLRVPRDITLQELKHRLYDKFVNQEHLLLSHSFSVVHALPPSAPSYSKTQRVPFSECTEMRFIDRESDWQKVAMSHQNGKITLRIVDTPS